MSAVNRLTSLASRLSSPGGCGEAPPGPTLRSDEVVTLLDLQPPLMVDTQLPSGTAKFYVRQLLNPFSRSSASLRLRIVSGTFSFLQRRTRTEDKTGHLCIKRKKKGPQKNSMCKHRAAPADKTVAMATVLKGSRFKDEGVALGSTRSSKDRKNRKKRGI